MTSHLSTSSFDVAAGAPAGTRRSGEASRVAAVLRRSLAYPPYAALITVGVIAVFHLIAAHLVVNQPLPDDRLLAKVRALTGDVSPVLIVAGDSRGRTGINPIQIAAALGVPQKSAVNIALPGCDTSSMRAAYRSFVRQETANPIMLMNLTIFSVNDAARKRAEMHDELLWSINWKDRFRVAPMGRAIVATFQPEKAIYRKMRDAIFPSVPRITEQGFKGRGPGDWSEALIASNVHLMSHDWYAGFQSSGIRWQQTERDLLALQTKGVQVVLVDLPMHPEFLRTANDQQTHLADAAFHEALASLAARLQIPLLQYDASIFGDDVDGSFADLAHLSRAGATVLTAQLTSDLSKLIDRGEITVPSTNAPRSASN